MDLAVVQVECGNMLLESPVASQRMVNPKPMGLEPSNGLAVSLSPLVEQLRSPLTLKERRFAKARRPPSINCALVAKEGARLNPFTNPDCQRISERYDVCEELGQGTTSVVYRAREVSGGGQVALKVLRTADEEMLRVAQEEYKVLRGIEHPHIIRALDCFTYPSGVVIAVELFDGQSLEDVVSNAPTGRLPEGVSCLLFAALMRAVSYLHLCSILHRDIKAGNVLVNKDLNDLRLVDFNTATRAVEGGALTMTGALDYLAPEVLLGSSHSQASDVWAAGLCLHLMLSGTLPIQRRLFASRMELGKAISTSMADRVVGQQWDHISPECRGVLQQCLAADPGDRPSAATVLACKWLCEVPELRPKAS